MHDIKIKWFRSCNPPKQRKSYNFYRRTFHTRFKLKFHTAKKDQCDACEAFKNTLPEMQNEDLEKSYQFHLKEKNLGKIFKKKKKEDSKQDQTQIDTKR